MVRLLHAFINEIEVEAIESPLSQLGIKEPSHQAVQWRATRIRSGGQLGCLAIDEQFQFRKVAGLDVFDNSGEETRELWTIQQHAHPQRRPIGR